MDTRLLAFDFDGTLFDEQNRCVPEEVYPLLQQVSDLGHHIALITGRWELPDDVLSQLPPHARATSTGGRIRINSEIHVQHLIAQEDVQEVIKLTHLEADLFAFSDQHFFTRLPQGTRSQRWQKRVPMKPFEEIHQAPILEMNVDHFTVTELKPLLAEQLPHLTLTGGQEPYPHLMTITPAQANKAEALKYIALTLGVLMDNTIAFGDSDNDLEMLKLAGHAVQVGNMPYLYEIAHEQLDHPTDVVMWLRRFLIEIG